MILYDQYGNPSRGIDALGGDIFTDLRTTLQNITALNGEVVIDCQGEHTAGFQLSGTFSLTLVAEASFDGTNYYSVPLWSVLLESYQLSATATGQFQFDIPAATRRIRLRCSAYTSGTANIALRASKAMDFVYAKDIPANLTLSATAASGTIVTLTLPAAGAGMFNYLVGLYINKFAAAALTAAATPVTVTSTGITGTPSFNFSAGGDLQGTSERQQIEPVKPLKGSAANTAMVFTCPATTGVIWRATAIYYIGA